ncbi:MAG: ATP-binding cassette domain-containing protein [Myxococcota bacterium]|nr:ATP-binding cassette domain-containing protein [Myxococcota bacterium]
MINLNDISKGFGATTLFEKVNMTFSPGRRYGLTGPNGAGKSTFMRILTGEEPADSGRISLPEKVGILRQDQHAYDAFTVMDTVIQGNDRLWKVNVEKEEIYAKGDAITDADGERLAELEMIVAEEDGYMAEVEAADLLAGLGVKEVLHYSLMSDLSAAIKVRALLAQSLFGSPQVLLLDEPTNHLDLDCIDWLKRFLVRYAGSLIVISHDRHFLNAVCTHIADIDYETIIPYPGNYDDMVEAKMAVRGRVEADHDQRLDKIEQLNGFIQRFRAGSRASQVKSRERQVTKLTPTELKRSNIQKPFIRFKVVNQPGKDVLRVEGVSLAFPKRGEHEPALTLLKNANLHIGRQERIAVIGPSGSGKTAMLNLIAGKLKADSGSIDMGHNVNFGFYAQDNFGAIKPGSSLLEWLHNKKPEESQEVVRGYLGQMLFGKEECFKKTDHLSGGERARLLFSELMLLQHNLLFLDEPTNHLDLESISALGEALEAFQGTCLVATHNQDLISAFATRIWAMTSKGFIDYHGDYAGFRGKYGTLR